jgi:hypothetical protein
MRFVRILASLAALMAWIGVAQGARGITVKGSDTMVM